MTLWRRKPRKPVHDQPCHYCGRTWRDGSPPAVRSRTRDGRIVSVCHDCWLGEEDVADYYGDRER